MTTPYSSKPDTSFWRRSVLRDQANALDPVIATAFTFSSDEAIATAGSCFAQHISRALRVHDFNYMVTEDSPLTSAADNENFGVFPARFGNIYSVRQLSQLMRRAYGLFYPVDEAWIRDDGRYIDPFRPLVQTAGFDSANAVMEDREAHLGAVRTMFEECDVFIFTLGLTERWQSAQDGAVFPVVPQSVANVSGFDEYVFENATVWEMNHDLREFIERLCIVNPAVKIILTVSPVPLIATYEANHVLVSNAYSKAALRVVAEEAVRAFSNVAYFPSYEIITAPHLSANYFGDDLREIRPAGVDHALTIFLRHFTSKTHLASVPAVSPSVHAVSENASVEEALMRKAQGVICDEEIIEVTH